MAHSNKTKFGAKPQDRGTVFGGSANSKETFWTESPESYYQKHPSWNFHSCDTGQWAFSKENVGDEFWKDILPKLKGWETMTWQQILVADKKHNHSIDVETLNKVARDRLEQLEIEAQAIVSLRVMGQHRLYGYMDGSVFNLMWFDNEHGDSDHCVCRSNKKHT